MEAAQAFCDFTVDYQKRTPKGLVYIDKFGTLCHAANVAFVCLQVVISLLHQDFPSAIFRFRISAMERLIYYEQPTPWHNHCLAQWTLT
jgi:hypothetical protein